MQSNSNGGKRNSLKQWIVINTHWETDIIIILSWSTAITTMYICTHIRNMQYYDSNRIVVYLTQNKYTRYVSNETTCICTCTYQGLLSRGEGKRGNYQIKGIIHVSMKQCGGTILYTLYTCRLQLCICCKDVQYLETWTLGWGGGDVLPPVWSTKLIQGRKLTNAFKEYQRFL